MKHHNAKKPGPVKCKYCSYSSTGEGAVERHMREFHADSHHGNEEISYKNDQMNNNDMSEASTAFTIPVQTSDVPKNPFVLENQLVSPPASVQSNISTLSGTSDSSLVCPECSITCKSMGHLNRHYIKHSNNHPFACKLCAKSYKRLSDLTRHIRKKHSARRIDLEELTDTHKDMPQPQGKKFKRKSNSNGESHDEFVLQEGSVEMPRMPGIICSTSVGGNEPLNLSISEKTFKGCAESLPFEKYASLLSVKPSYSNKFPRNPNVKCEKKISLKCNQCSYLAKCASDLQRHKTVHSADKKIKCYVCGKRFKLMGDRNKHLRNIHGVPIGKPRKANLERRRAKPTGNVHGIATAKLRKMSMEMSSKGCKPTENPHSLTKKKKSEGGKSMENPFTLTKKKNSEKRKGTPTESVGAANKKINIELKKEKLQEISNLNGTNPTPWACLFCDYKCEIRGDIKVHLQAVHKDSVIQYGDLEHLVDQTYCLVSGEQLTPVLTSDGKMVQCPYCPYQNDSKAKMKNHIEIHDDLKRYMCSDCGKRSNWIWDVRKHIRKCHPKSALDVVQLSEEEARSTLAEYIALRKRSQTESQNDRSDASTLSDSGKSSGSRKSPLTTDKPSEDKIRPQEKLKPFKCSSCGQRANYKYDMQKHIKYVCRSAKLITLCREEAEATISDYVKNFVVTTKKSAIGKKNIKPLLKSTGTNLYLQKLIADKNRPFKVSYFVFECLVPLENSHIGFSFKM